MEGFTIIDGVVALVIVMSAMLAYSRGFVREAMAIAAGSPPRCWPSSSRRRSSRWSRKCPWWAAFPADSCELSIIAAFAVVCGGAGRVALHAALFLHRAALGASAGSTRGLAFSSACCAGSCSSRLPTIVTSQDVAIIDDSRSARVFARLTSGVDESDPQAALGWITRQYEELVALRRQLGSVLQIDRIAPTAFQTLNTIF
jgi:membrane protein required for colicin V production